MRNVRPVSTRSPAFLTASMFNRPDRIRRRAVGLFCDTYDREKKCHQSWGFSSISGGPESPSEGKWNEATKTIEWSGMGNEEQASTLQMCFVSDDMIASNFMLKDAGGEILLKMEFKMTRLKRPQK